MDTAVNIAFATFLGTLLGMLVNAAVFGWWFRGWLEKMRSELVQDISSKVGVLQTAFNAQITSIESDVRKLVVDFAEHRVEDKGWFRNLGERLARVEAENERREAKYDGDAD